MLPTYPLTRFVLEPTEPETTVVSRRAPSGRIRTYDVGSFSDHPITLRHVVIQMPDVNLVMDFWRTNRGRMFAVENADMGEHWVGAFLARPAKQHIEGPWYDLVVNMVRYDPAEGGL